MRVTPKTRARAKSLRANFTDAERILWSRLKNKQLFGHHFRAQHPIGPYIVHFACVRERLVIEVDGETHSTQTELAHDVRRTRFLEREGWHVLRFWNDEVYKNLDGVLRAITEILPPPSR